MYPRLKFYDVKVEKLKSDRYSNLFLIAYINRLVHAGYLNRIEFYSPLGIRHVFLYDILSEASKPPLDIFSYILTYMIHTWLKFTLNMEKLIKQNLSKFHFHKLKIFRKMFIVTEYAALINNLL